MSSSDDRRRPRVAGHRRRPNRVAVARSAPAVDGPLTSADAVPAAAVDAAPAREVDAVPFLGVDAAPVPGVDAAPEPATVVDEELRDPDEAPVPSRPRRGGLRLRRDLVAPLVALALALAALAVVGAVSLQDPGARERDARAATAAARADLEQLLSYDHASIAAQAERNAALLTGPFRQEYATTMRTKIAPVAQQEQAVVRARTYEAGVMSQGDDTVTVQVFLNQAKTAKGQEQPSVDQNRVIATMQRVDGRWLIARLSAY